MSYSRNVFTGYFLRITNPQADWYVLEDPSNADSVTNGRATPADIEACAACHVIFPEFLRTKGKDKYLFVMMPGYTKLADVGHADSHYVDISATTLEYDALLFHSIVEKLQRIFGSPDTVMKFGTFVEVA